MKKFLSVTSALFIFLLNLSANTFAYNKSLDGKIGTGYVEDPEKFGWQLNFAYFADLDPFFALGFEPGIYWAHWDRVVGRQQLGLVEADVKSDTNAYIIPILINAQIRLPNLESKIFVIPYVTLGLGYSLMIFDYSTPSYTDTSSNHVESENKTKLFHGLTWQIMFGASYDPGSSSKIKFIAELGYRSAKLYHDDLQVDMSGFILNIGVKYPLGSSDSSKSL